MSDANVTAAASSARIDADLHEQWDALIDWLRTLDDDLLTASTPLPEWTVRDLVAHLALVMRVLSGAEIADDDAPTITFADYLAAYADTSSDIRQRAIDLAEQHDPIGSAETSGQAALATLSTLRGQRVRTVRVSRGVVGLDTLVLTRLVELVVHADDLARSAKIPSPVDPTARTIVSDALLRVLRARTGYDLEVGDETAWLRLATGRSSWGERGAALRSGNLAEGLPDLSNALPLIG